MSYKADFLYDNKAYYIEYGTFKNRDIAYVDYENTPIIKDVNDIIGEVTWGFNCEHPKEYETFGFLLDLENMFISYEDGRFTYLYKDIEDIFYYYDYTNTNLNIIDEL